MTSVSTDVWKDGNGGGALLLVFFLFCSLIWPVEGAQVGLGVTM